MKNFNVVKNTRIVFNRIDDISVLGYKVFVKEEQEDKTIEYLLTKINNFTVPNPIFITKEFFRNEKQEYILETSNLYISYSHPVKILVNGVDELKSELYDIDITEKQLKILYQELPEDYFIVVEFYIDAIEFFHNTNNYCEYEIFPIISQDSGNVGFHSEVI